MTIFFRLVWEQDKAKSLHDCVADFRVGKSNMNVFRVEAADFSDIPGSPFAYWVSRNVRETFKRFGNLEEEGHQALHGASSKDDFRFLRLWWEPSSLAKGKWLPFSKGGAKSPFYMDISTCINWENDAREIEAAALHKYPYLDNADWILHKEQPYFKPVLYQTLRSNGLALYVTPRGCIFGDNGFQIFSEESNLFGILGLLNSKAGNGIFSLLLGRAGYAIYRNGAARKFPIPKRGALLDTIALISKRLWECYRRRDLANEVSHAFVVPKFFGLAREAHADESLEIEKDIARLDDAAYSLFGLSEDDRKSIEDAVMPSSADDEEINADEELEDQQEGVDEAETLSWALGVGFGRFDWRLAIGENAPPPEPDPFDPLPSKSPAMLSDSAELFHAHDGILVDDPGHPHDLTHLVEEVFALVGAPAPIGVRRWLQRDFFPFHLRNYSKSRRKAPIYWPLSTSSGSYTLWLYYPSLTSQTLYTAVNDFIEGPNGKLRQVEQESATLRNMGSARSRDEDKKLEALQLLESELIEFRDNLLRIAPTYRPDHDDGVQITAAPLWPLFRHRSWQKLLKDTWTKLEKGDYDWANLAIAYWPERVREKCKTDKSLAIAHDLEQLYVEPAPKPAKTRGKKGAGA